MYCRVYFGITAEMNKRYRQCDAADCRHYGTAVCVDIGNDGLWDMLPAAGIGRYRGIIAVIAYRLCRIIVVGV